VYYTFYDTRWNKDGSLKSAIPCATMRHHVPRADQWTYALGYSAVSCAILDFATPGTDATIYGVFYYVTIWADGRREFLDDQDLSAVLAS